MAPRCPASLEPLGCGPIWKPATHLAAALAAEHLPARASAQAARPVLFVFGVLVPVPPTNAPLFRCCVASQAVARFRAARKARWPLLALQSWITAYDVVSGSAGLFRPQDWPAESILEKFRRK